MRLKIFEPVLVYLTKLKAFRFDASKTVDRTLPVFPRLLIEDFLGDILAILNEIPFTIPCTGGFQAGSDAASSSWRLAMTSMQNCMDARYLALSFGSATIFSGSYTRVPLS
jgi:hypothetical protein